MTHIRKEPPVEQFLKDVSTHQLEIQLDNGVHRCLRFRKPDHGYHLWFYVSTWPGHLCISGDMGSFVFARLPDMFQFFRGDKINPDYWAEKCEAQNRRGSGVEEWDEEIFRRAIKERFDNYFADEPDCQVAKDECWQEVMDQVLSAADDGEHWAMTKAMSFSHQWGELKHQTFEFHDFWEVSCKSYTYHFIWCCYAIQWAIQQYDRVKTRKFMVSHNAVDLELTCAQCKTTHHVDLSKTMEFECCGIRYLVERATAPTEAMP